MSHTGVRQARDLSVLLSVCLQGRFEEALTDYTAAIQLNPGHCRAFYNRAFSNDRLRRYDAAVADYTRALEIQPGNATAYHNRASLFERLGRSVLPLAPPNSVSTLHHLRHATGLWKGSTALDDCPPECQTTLDSSYCALKHDGPCGQRGPGYTCALK